MMGVCETMHLLFEYVSQGGEGAHNPSWPNGLIIIIIIIIIVIHNPNPDVIE
jgi:hypothetical protein